MATDSFEKLWKGLLLRCPDLPLPLAQDYIRYSYRRALNKSSWGATRATGEFIIPTPYSTGTVTVTQNSTTVTGIGTSFLAASHDGLQLKIGIGPFYTVTVVDPTTLTLDRVYAGTSETVSYSLSRVYVTAPSDFRAFISVWDPTNAWRLRRGYTAEFIDSADPMRTSTGPAKILASGYYTSSGLPTFELWPRPTSPGAISYRYYKEIPDLSANSDKIIFPMGGEAIIAGALYEVSKHPGTAEKSNPYFSLGLAAQSQKDFEQGMGEANTKDQNIYLTDFWRAEDQLPYAPLNDLSYFRDHAPFYPYA